MTDFSRPVFIVSAPRSGSTLLRLILDAHPRLAVPPPAWLYELVQPYLYSYGDISKEENFRALAEDILETPTIKEWEMGIELNQLIAASKEHSFRGLYEGLHCIYSESTGKVRWGEKSPRNCFWMDEIKRDFSDVQFIHIIRDGRDMAIDIADSPFMLPNSVYAGAQIWQLFTDAVEESASRLAKDEYYPIKYEALCGEPEKELRKLCEFLREDFDSKMLSHYESGSTKMWGAKANHAKTSRPISTEFCEMYKHRLSEPDVLALEGLIGKGLKGYGYPVNVLSKPLPPREAAQLIESELPSSPTNFEYRRWHAQRRRERREQGIWKDEDRNSLLWSLY